ncbi:hypothetical protein ACFQX7_33605 [Luedemannella flava]
MGLTGAARQATGVGALGKGTGVADGLDARPSTRSSPVRPPARAASSADAVSPGGMLRGDASLPGEASLPGGTGPIGDQRSQRRRGRTGCDTVLAAELPVPAEPGRWVEERSSSGHVAAAPTGGCAAVVDRRADGGQGTHVGP